MDNSHRALALAGSEADARSFSRPDEEATTLVESQAPTLGESLLESDTSYSAEHSGVISYAFRALRNAISTRAQDDSNAESDMRCDPILFVRLETVDWDDAAGCSSSNDVDGSDLFDSQCREPSTVALLGM